MAGGYKPGAGRPRKVADVDYTDIPKVPGVPSEVVVLSNIEGMSPLEYMLMVMRDDSADPNRRDRMAIAAAPFVHSKVETAKPGKKEQAKLTAERADEGTVWERLLS
jgi:hypothetical protein